ncbi:MAG TPA: hypothetical protein VHW44_06695 [Pseudonocardiaceae bacterium]|nr:hypothetical protein [Pseudonocardiaceae bacterium]
MSTTEVESEPTDTAELVDETELVADAPPAEPVEAEVTDGTDGTAVTDLAAGLPAWPAWPGSPGWSGRRTWLLLSPAVAYLAVRAVGLLVLAWTAGRNNTTVAHALTSWDGQWYLGIAGGGYHSVPQGLVDAFGRRTADTPFAFFPGYPELVQWIGQLPGVGLVAAALTVSAASGVAAAYALQRIGRVVGGDDRVGLILVVLFAASPMAITLSMAYSEATFCALAAWSLVGVLERKWLLAGLAAAGAGLVRPTAAALVFTVLVAAAIAVLRRRDSWRPWLGGLLAPAGLVGYLIVVASVTGNLGGWFTLQQQGWNSKFDWGAATVRFGLDVLANGRSVLEVGTVGFLLAAVALVVVSVRRGVPWPLVAYGTLVLIIDVGSNGLMNSKARLLLPAFTLLVPVAVGLAKRRRGTVLAVLAGVVLASAWFGAYAVTGWQYAI